MLVDQGAVLSQEMTSRERSPEIETVIDRHLSQQTQLTTIGSLAGPGPELDRPQPSGVILWDKVLYNRSSTASISSISSQQEVACVRLAAYSTPLFPLLTSIDFVAVEFVSVTDEVFMGYQLISRFVSLGFEFHVIFCY